LLLDFLAILSVIQEVSVSEGVEFNIPLSR